MSLTCSGKVQAEHMLTPALAQEGTEPEVSCTFGAALGADFTGCPQACKDKVTP